MRDMKDSGLNWITEIPKDWKVDRLKYKFSFGKGLPITKDNLEDEGIAVISYGQVHSKVNTGTNIDDELIRYVNERYLRTNAQSLVHKNDFIFADTSEDLTGCGNCVYVDKEMQLFAGYHTIILRALNEDTKYFSYLFLTDEWRKQLREKVSGVKLFSVTQKIIKEAGIIIPPISEQKKITAYLDKKCNEIRLLCKDIQSQISSLEEYKRSVITEAVTKGLNADVEMKDSGVEWIGQIPKKWETIKIGHIFSLRNERNFLPEEEVQLLSLYTGIGVFPQGEHTTASGNHAQTVMGYKVVHKNDIVVNIILAWMGSIGVSDYDGVTSPAYDVYIPDLTKVVPHYFHYVFRTSGIAGECYKYGRGIMMMRWRTYSQEFKQIIVPFPSLEEQKIIADYLDTKCTEIDNAILEKKKQLETLEQYKKSLIYEYVTGKKEVPNE